MSNQDKIELTDLDCITNMPDVRGKINIILFPNKNRFLLCIENYDELIKDTTDTRRYLSFDHRCYLSFDQFDYLYNEVKKARNKLEVENNKIDTPTEIWLHDRVFGIRKINVIRCLDRYYAVDLVNGKTWTIELPPVWFSTKEEAQAALDGKEKSS